MMRHDGRQITSLTIWPDVAALRELSAGMARRIDLRSTDPAAPVVAALRATIPATEGKLSVGQERQQAGMLTPEDATLLPGAPPAPETVLRTAASAKAKGKGKGKDGKGKDKAAPKAPLPRSVRRLRGIAAGVLMLGLAAALAGYVVARREGSQAGRQIRRSVGAAHRVADGEGVTGRGVLVHDAVPSRAPSRLRPSTPGRTPTPSRTGSCSRSTAVPFVRGPARPWRAWSPHSRDRSGTATSL